MSATYNWAYKPNVTNKYGIIIDNSTDDVAPDNAYYVSLSGNDLTGNGSRLYPYKTLETLPNSGGKMIIISSGVYRASSFNGNFLGGSYIGDGDVIIDFAYQGPQNFNDRQYYNIKFRGNNTVKGGGVLTKSIDCIFENCSWNEYNGSGNSRIHDITYTKVFNTSSHISIIDQQSSGVKEYLTFYNCSNIDISIAVNDPNVQLRTTIFSKCNININLPYLISCDYILFHQCNFTFSNSNTECGSIIYPSVPTGYQYIDNIDDFRSAYLSVYPQLTTPFLNSNFGDPLFNNPDIGDLSLNINSPAKNMSYYGSFIGSSSIGFPIKASATASITGFDTSSSNNLTVSDDSIILIDTTQDAQIDSVVISNLVQREISKFPSYGFMADRNGQYIDTIADLDTVTKNPGDVLAFPSSYIVENGSISYNGQVLQPGDRFTTVTGVTTFTTTAGGDIREILEAPQRHTIMARFGNGDSTPLTSSSPIVVGNWYYVSVGSITHNSISHNNGSIFKAVTTSFTGTGTITLSMSNESYQHYEPGIQPTTNNVGDVRSGDVIRGNGDPNYVRGGLNITEFPINAKYVQVRYQIKVNNLKP